MVKPYFYNPLINHCAYYPAGSLTSSVTAQMKEKRAPSFAKKVTPMLDIVQMNFRLGNAVKRNDTLFVIIMGLTSEIVYYKTQTTMRLGNILFSCLDESTASFYVIVCDYVSQ